MSTIWIHYDLLVYGQRQVLSLPNTISILWLRIWWTRDTLPVLTCVAATIQGEIWTKERCTSCAQQTTECQATTQSKTWDVNWTQSWQYRHLYVLWNSDADRPPYQYSLSIRQAKLSSTSRYPSMHNKSAVFYTGLLCSTLKEDYAIDARERTVDTRTVTGTSRYCLKVWKQQLWKILSLT
jgi:hypothetical protein